MVGADDRPPTSMAVNIMLRRGTKVVGTVPWVRGDSIHTVTYSRMSPKLRVVGWLRLLALSAALPERQFEAVTIARGQGRRPRFAGIGRPRRGHRNTWVSA